MVENDAKDSFGCFSVAGRNSAEKFKIIAYKDKILKGKNSNNTEQCRGEQRDEPVEDYLDIFEDDYNEKKEESIKKLRYRKSHTSKPSSERYKYHNQHKNEVKPPSKKLIGPTCTKYNPKRDYTWNRSVSGPKWRTQSARVFHVKQDNTHYYLNHEAITANIVGSSLIDMSKMTMRGEFSDVKDLRIKTIKPFCKSNSMKEIASAGLNKIGSDTRNKESKEITVSSCQYNQEADKQQQLLLKRQTIKTSPYTRRISSAISFRKIIKKQLINTTTSSLNDSYDDYKHIYQKQFKKRTQSADISKIKKKRNQIRAPDFKKAITKQHLDKLEDKSSLIPFSLPNFKLVRERPIMMVVYDQIRHKILKQHPMKGMDSNIDFNPDRYINRINNHSVASPPNFNLMASRTINSDPLPLYMKNIYSRAAAYETTDLTLKMNNYVNSKFATQLSSFTPKKTFNKIINLNLLNSKKFLSNAMWKSDSGKDKLSKSMKFYRKITLFIINYTLLIDKNYNDLMKENVLSQFDGVTYKAYKRESKLNAQDIENFLYDYEMETKIH